MRKNTKEKTHENLIWVFFIFGILLILSTIIIFFSGLFNRTPGVIPLPSGPKITYGDPLIREAALVYPQALPDDPQLGQKSVPVTIFFYCDLLSDLCAREQLEIDRLMSTAQAYARVVWKGTAATPPGLLAQQAVYCANGQRKPWEMQRQLFDLDSEPTQKLVVNIAASLGLDMERFDSCLLNEATIDKVYANNQDATDLGIDALPYFFINDYPYRGFLSASDFMMIIKSVVGNF